MRSALLAGLLLAAAARANYFSEGWKPGQPTAKFAPSATGAGFDPSQATLAPADDGKPKGFWESLFTTGPLGALMKSAGLNVSAAIEKASKNEQWDSRIPLIDDSNYADIIVNEHMTLAEESERVWFLVITAGSGQSNAISTFVDKHFDEAYNISTVEGDLPHVRWGRISYMDVTYLTTKWNVWKPPVLVVLTNRGQTLRFYYPQTLVIRAQALHDFMARDFWKQQEPWSSPWAPGGSREWLLEYIAIVSTAIYSRLAKVPKILILLATGGLTSVMVNFLHRNDKKPEPKPRRPVSTNPALAALANANIGEPEPEPTADTKKAAKKRKSGRGI